MLDVDSICAIELPLTPSIYAGVPFDGGFNQRIVNLLSQVSRVKKLLGTLDLSHGDGCEIRGGQIAQPLSDI